jgi:hypothetical protein
MLPAVLLLCFMLFMPESPRWLARKDRWEECHRILTLIHGKGDPDSPLVHYEMEDIKAACALEASLADVTYWELFYPKNIYRTVSLRGITQCNAKGGLLTWTLSTLECSRRSGRS